MLLTSEVFTFIHRAIGPLFFAVTVLQIVHPLSLVARPIHVDVDALAIGLVIDPVALVDVAVNVGELSETVGAVILPIAFITCAIGPNLDAEAVSEPANPLARILCPGRVCVGRPLLTLGIRVVRDVRNGLFELDRSEVAAISPFSLLDQGNFHTGRVAAPQSLQSNYVSDVGFEKLEAGPIITAASISISCHLIRILLNTNK